MCPNWYKLNKVPNVPSISIALLHHVTSILGIVSMGYFRSSIGHHWLIQHRSFRDKIIHVEDRTVFVGSLWISNVMLRHCSFHSGVPEKLLNRMAKFHLCAVKITGGKYTVCILKLQKRWRLNLETTVIA